MKRDDNEAEYYAKIDSYRAKQKKEKEVDNSNFTIVSLVGFMLGVGIFYNVGHVVLGTIICTFAGALLGAFLDYRQLGKERQ